MLWLVWLVTMAALGVAILYFPPWGPVLVLAVAWLLGQALREELERQTPGKDR